ncbi:hypothetical protein [Prochlorococcus marinus]|uniref:Uncharacterized protein n=1 Tax=Prochlorococcus marinus str. PAC1 TaxID=59924 RepID=A0A0A2C1C3_PROMR|nr:hypothetical protein [Prochlorococcus marinus]KGG20093.1 hypothetical protein EV03_1557 [Prochlorococcus marinus str. PAC1]
MNQNFQAIVQNTREDNTSNDQTFLLGGVLIVFNLFVMLFVGLYWMNPVMHEFISGRPLL